MSSPAATAASAPGSAKLPSTPTWCGPSSLPWPRVPASPRASSGGRRAEGYVLVRRERILPSAGLPTLRKCALQVVEHLFAVGALHVRHLVARHHDVERLVPAGARHALRRH